jgi:hypothetical protein
MSRPRLRHARRGLGARRHRAPLSRLTGVNMITGPGPAIGSAWGLVVRDDRTEPLVVLRLKDFAELAKAAPGNVTLAAEIVGPTSLQRSASVFAKRRAADELLFGSEKV